MIQRTSTTSSEAEQETSGITEVYNRLRTMILNGVYPPGMLLPQRELARSLGVSRTPLREVLRMLQAEGLVEAARYQRSQVTSFDPESLDALYASRVQLETLGMALTIARLQSNDLEALNDVVEKMHNIQEIDDWEKPHHLFHRLLVAHAGTHLSATITGYIERSERYVRIYGRLDPSARSVSMNDHEQILRAYIERNEEEAMQLLAQHLTRTALTVLAQLAPAYEPVAVRKALHLVQANQTRPDRVQRPKR